MAKIRGKIIRIIDKRTLIINLGREDGISDENVFMIHGAPEEIIDPQTNKVLGVIKVVKARVKASQVFDNFTIATTKWKEVTLGTIFNVNFDDAFGSKLKDRDEGDMKVRPEDIQPFKAKSEEPVLIGDVVEVEISDSKTPPKKDLEQSKETR
jgi:hypothetical protein